MFSFICTCTEPNLHQQVVQLLVAKSGPFFIVFNVEGLQIHLKLSFCIILTFYFVFVSKSCLFWANSSSSEITFTLRLFDAILNKFPRNKVVSFWSYTSQSASCQGCIPLEHTKNTRFIGSVSLNHICLSL